MVALKFKLIVLAAVVLVGLQQAQSKGLSDMVTSFMDSNRVTRCPVPGKEYEFKGGKISIYMMNFPKETCKKVCQDESLVSIEGSEQAAFGPKIFCCCKPAESAASTPQ